MPKTHKPKRGSRAFWPKKRTRRETARIKSWPADGGDQPRLQGFAGYKVGMTHAHIVDYRPTSTTSGQEVLMPVTVVEAPPLKVAAVRVYTETPYGLKTLTEVWADKLDKDLSRSVPLPKGNEAGKKWELVEAHKADLGDLRVLVHTQPRMVKSLPKKKPELFELRIGGGTLDQKLEYAKGLLGKTVDVGETVSAGDMMDVVAATKGKGFQGHVKRFGVKLLTHKNSKHRRMIGTQGSWHPNWVQATVPNAGQLGYQQRTEYNKRVLVVGDNGGDITPAGGFPHYGVVGNKYLLFHGSLPGPRRRLIRLRQAVRYRRGVKVEAPQVAYVSTSSKQGR